MSDELFEKDESEDEDVEAHKTRLYAWATTSSEGDDDVEAHKKKLWPPTTRPPTTTTPTMSRPTAGRPLGLRFLCR